MVPNVDAMVAVTLMRVLLFVLHVCLLGECDGARLMTLLVWGMDEMWLVQGMWVLHVVQALCLACPTLSMDCRILLLGFA